MMAVSIKEREAQLESLNSFISNSEQRLSSILSTLGWDADKIQEEKGDTVSCPINKEHYVPEDKLEKHLARCSWRNEGYHDEDVPLPESCGPGGSSITIDKEVRTRVLREALAQNPDLKTDVPAVGLDERPVPKTVNRIMSDFTPDERRVLYDFVVSKTQGTPMVKVEDLNMPMKKEEKQQPKTYWERLAAERDAKRRKMSKKTHTNRKSHVEIMREVIQNQMELYEEYLKQEFPSERKSEDRDSEQSHDSAAGESSRYSYKDLHSFSDKKFDRRSQYDAQSCGDKSNAYQRNYGREDHTHRKYSDEDRDHRKYKIKEESRNYYSYNRDSKERYNSSYSHKSRHRSRSYDDESVQSQESTSYEYQKQKRHMEERKQRDKRHSSHRDEYRSQEYRDRSEHSHQKRQYGKSYSRDSASSEEERRDRKRSKNGHSSVAQNSDKYNADSRLRYQSSQNAAGSENGRNSKSGDAIDHSGSESDGASRVSRDAPEKVVYSRTRESDERTSSESSVDVESSRHRKHKHKRKKHKKHKHHRKSSHKSKAVTHSYEDFSC